MAEVDYEARAAELAANPPEFPVLPEGHPDKGQHILWLGPNLRGEVVVGARTYDLNPDVIYLDSHDEALAVAHAAHPGRRGVSGWDHPDAPKQEA